MSDFNNKNFSDTTDAVVEQILKEAAEDWERRDKFQEQANHIFQYEAQRYW
jgi:hypothetical protein